MLKSTVFDKKSIPKIYDNNYLIDLEDIELSKLEVELCKELIKRTKQDEKEHGTAIQHGMAITQNGEVYYYTSSLRDKIKIPNEILDLANDKTSNLTLIHSHPDNLPPSGADLEQLLKLGVTSVIIVGKDSLVFKIENISDDRPSEKEWCERINNIDFEINEILVYNDTFLNMTLPDRKFQHEFFYRIVREFEWKARGGYLNE